jgi:hypothetical protein
MTWGQPLGFDELMIVNPSPLNTDAYFLSEDGTLYQVQGLGQIDESQEDEQYFLGDDGTLYHVQGLAESESLQNYRQYFLRDDNTIYQVQGVNL